MPWLRCSVLGCPGVVLKGQRCETHRKALKAALDARRPTASARGYIAAGWRRLRLELLLRDPICTWGSLERDRPAASRWQPCAALSTVAAHIIPREVGGSDELTNLRGLCARHHNRETALHDGGFGHKPVA